MLNINIFYDISLFVISNKNFIKILEKQRVKRGPGRPRKETIINDPSPVLEEPETEHANEESLSSEKLGKSRRKRKLPIRYIEYNTTMIVIYL